MMHSLKNGQSWPLELHKQAPLKGFASLPLIVAISLQLEKMPGFEITQDNKYRWEAKQVKIEGDTTEEQILSYRQEYVK